MVIKVYISSISGNKEIKRKQDFILRLLSSSDMKYEEVDISDSTNDDKKAFMRENSKTLAGQKVPLPPQVFNDDVYCGDFDDFEDANENSELQEFLKMAPKKEVSQATLNMSEVNANIKGYVIGENSAQPAEEEKLNGEGDVAAGENGTA